MRKLLESCVRSRLSYSVQAWLPKEVEMKKLEVCQGRRHRVGQGGHAPPPPPPPHFLQGKLLKTNFYKQNI